MPQGNPHQGKTGLSAWITYTCLQVEQFFGTLRMGSQGVPGGNEPSAPQGSSFFTDYSPSLFQSLHFFQINYLHPISCLLFLWKPNLTESPVRQGFQIESKPFTH